MYNPIRYLSKLIHKLGRGKKLPKNVGFLFHFQVTLQTLTCWAKIRPIWSPWLAIRKAARKRCSDACTKIGCEIWQWVFVSRCKNAFEQFLGFQVVFRACLLRRQGCQMVYFQTKNTNLGKFLWAFDWKLLIYFTSIWNIFRTLGKCYDHVVHIA
jgi:hypothetical protein